MALLVIQDHEHKHEYEYGYEHDEHDNKQHYEGGQGLLVVGRTKSKSRTINKSRTKSSINSNSSTTTTSTSCSSSSSSSSSPIRAILIPILVGCILMALGATFQSTQIIFNNNNSNSNDDGNNIGIRRKTTTSSSTKDFGFIYPPPKYERNKYTFDSFIVGGGNGIGKEGIDLAKFGFEDEDDDDKDAVTVASSTTSASTRTRTNYADFDYELFHDFDLSLKLTGNESWIDLLALRRDSGSRSLSFYVDKVAYKRYLINQYSILHIDSIPSYLLKYKYELEFEFEFEFEKLERDNDSSSSPASSSSLSLLSSLSNKIERYLPKDQDYAAKPTHLSCSGGVWIIHNDIPNNITYVGNGKKKMVPHNTDTVTTTNTDSTTKSKLSKLSKSIPSSITTIIANDIAQNLNKVQDKCGNTVLESYALRNVKPGVVVEERFTQPSSSSFSIDNEEDEVEVENNYNANHENHNENDHENLLLKGGMEFKVFTIWGRAWLTVWRPGVDGVQALLYRNGTNLIYNPPMKQKKQKKDKNKSNSNLSPPPSSPTATPAPPIVTKLPKWIDWERVIEIGEKLGRNKDMFRTDIFVGVTASSSSSSASTKSYDNNNNNKSNIIRYVVSETEIHPTPLRGYEIIFNEAGRLWLAGYYYYYNANANIIDAQHQLHQHQQHQQQQKTNKFNIKVIQNNEVPYGFYQ